MKSQPAPSFLQALALIVVISTIYLFGLDNPYIPSNGDEAPYLNITRNLIEQQQWLPLQSDTEALNNTKPPLLFWQGRLSAQIHGEWQLWSLRVVSVVYSLLIGLLLAVFCRFWAGNWRTALFAFAIYFSFLTTFRYGRPFLTSAPESFWVFLTLLIYFYSRVEPNRQSAWLWLLPMAISSGIGLLYKSFALLFPLLLTIGLLEWHRLNWRIDKALWNSFWFYLLYGGLALLLFASWFLFDPSPQAIWQDFILGENFQKLEQQDSYWQQLLFGPDNAIRSIVLGLLYNSGFLLAACLWVFIYLIIRWKHLDSQTQALLIAVGAFMLFFSIPSQRSSRYLLPIMPFAALLIARYRHIIPGWFALISASLAFAYLAFLALASLSLQLQLPQSWWPSVAINLMLLSCLLFWIHSWRHRARGLSVLITVSLAGFLATSLFLQPFNGPLSHFQKLSEIETKTPVQVPVRFVHKEEYWRLRLPGFAVQPYYDVPRWSEQKVHQLQGLYILQLPLQQQPKCTQCIILDRALSLNTRLNNDELKRLQTLDWSVFFRWAYLLKNEPKSLSG